MSSLTDELEKYKEVTSGYKDLTTGYILEIYLKSCINSNVEDST